MGYKMLRNLLKTIKNFLLILLLFLFVAMLFIKARIYKIKKEIRDIESQILALDKEMEILNLEITYLTRPERLKDIYYTIKNVSNNNKIIVGTNQIKDIKVLIPYYYVKNNSKNSIAKK